MPDVSPEVLLVVVIVLQGGLEALMALLRIVSAEALAVFLASAALLVAVLKASWAALTAVFRLV